MDDVAIVAMKLIKGNPIANEANTFRILNTWHLNLLRGNYQAGLKTAS